MDKLQMAHDYAMQLVASPDYDDDMSLVDFVAHVWKYADAMQAEEDKRKPSGLPEALCEVDWSQAPDDATHYVIFADGLAYWYKSEKLECFDIAPSFCIVGMFVVERPHGF